LNELPRDWERSDRLDLSRSLAIPRELILRRGGPAAASAPPSVRPAAVQPPIGGGFCEVDVSALTARGFATQPNVNAAISADLRRIKRPLLLAVNKSAAQGAQRLPPNLIVITSALPGEGKTFVSINLALSIAAELDRTVLLVDADVARNGVAQALEVKYEVGLTNILERGSVHVEDTVMQTNIESLSLLLSGRMVPNIDALIASDKMARVMRELAVYDPNRIVIVDAPPVHAGTEASVLARMAGQVLVVIEEDKTPQAAVMNSLHQLKGCESVNLILNKARRRLSDQAMYGYGYVSQGN
jgi:protein-tyrosine kinase